MLPGQIILLDPYILDVKFCEKGLWANFVIRFDVADPDNHDKTITSQAVSSIIVMSHAYYTPHTWYAHLTGHQRQTVVVRREKEICGT